MKLIVQIPCYNEESTLSLVLKEIPKKLDGIDVIEILVIDDGSSDKTVEIAKKNKVDHIIEIQPNKGLANAFMTGIRYCIKQGADIVINTDGDNQYCGENIIDLVKVIVEDKADIVIGNRDLLTTKHMTKNKRRLQIIGSAIMSIITFNKIMDATSGFRAYNKNALDKLQVKNKFTYTLETLITMSKLKFRIKFVPIKTNKTSRPSRLFKSNLSYVLKSIRIVFITLVRIYYKIIICLALLVALFIKCCN